jgi:hypothetical protein
VVTRSRDADHSLESTLLTVLAAYPSGARGRDQSGRRRHIRVEFGPLGNPAIVTVIWPSLPHSRAASTVQESREGYRLAVRDSQHPFKSDPSSGLKNDWATALLVALQLVMLVLLLTGRIR